jgi:hypothetical protein
MTDDVPFGTPFATLAAAVAPPYDAMLVALEREFRALDGERVADTLDELARPLLELRSRSLRLQATALAATARAALAHDGDGPASWLLGCALDEQRASAPVRAVLAVELGRRAGIAARPVRMRGRWLVGVHEHGSPVAADVGRDPIAGVTDACTGCLCAHAVAFLLLGGLAGAWRAAGDLSRARRAAGLRLLLPLDPELRARVLEESLRLGEAS